MPIRFTTLDQFSFTVNEPLELCMARLEAGINFQRVGWRRRSIKQYLDLELVEEDKCLFEAIVQTSFSTFIEGDLQRDSPSTTRISGKIQVRPYVRCLSTGSLLFMSIICIALLWLSAQRGDGMAFACAVILMIWLTGMLLYSRRYAPSGNNSILALCLRDTLQAASEE